VSARLITLTSTLIILDITQTSSNNCLLIVQAEIISQLSVLFSCQYIKCWAAGHAVSANKLLFMVIFKVRLEVFYNI
jgi:hypothetical protein